METLELSVYKRWNSSVWQQFEGGLKEKKADLDLLSADFDGEEGLEAVWEHMTEHHADIRELKLRKARPITLVSRLPAFRNLRTLTLGFVEDFSYAEASSLARFYFPLLTAVSLDVDSVELMLGDERSTFCLHLRALAGSWSALERLGLVSDSWDLALDLVSWLPDLGGLAGLSLRVAALSTEAHRARLEALLRQCRTLESLILPPTLELDDEALGSLLASCVNFSTSLRILGRGRGLDGHRIQLAFPNLARQEVWTEKDEMSLVGEAEARLRSARSRRGSTLTNKSFFDAHGNIFQNHLMPSDALKSGSGSRRGSKTSVAAEMETALTEQRDELDGVKQRLEEDEREREAEERREAEEERVRAREAAEKAREDAIRSRVLSNRTASSGGRRRSAFGY